MKKMSTKLIVLLLAVALLFGCGVGGTIAWLVTQSGTVTNTFTIGNIKIALEETTTTYKMVPGGTIDKDPKVTVEADSEACWLFVEVVEDKNDFTMDGEQEKFITYTAADGWTELDGNDGVFYRVVTADDAKNSVTYEVFKDNEVSVSDKITKPIMDAIGENKPTLSITAYAVQKENIDTAAVAWTQAQNANNYPTPPADANP